MPSATSLATVTLAGGSRIVRHDYASKYQQDHGYAPLNKKELPPRSRMVLHMQLRGFRQKEIAEVLGIKQEHVSRICRSGRYLAVLDAKLNEVDDEFLRLKPKAFRALDNALCSRDEGLGLRAAETWFKAHGYKGFGPQNAGITVNVMAEDVAIQLLNAADRRREADATSTAPEGSPCGTTQGQGNSP